MSISTVRNSAIFRGLSDEDFNKAITSLNAYEKSYLKGQVIFSAGETIDCLGLVTEGSVTVEINDVWGGRTILNNTAKGQFFGETYALLDEEPLLVDVVANEDCRILFLRISELGNESSGLTEGRWQECIMRNLLAITAGKNLHLSERSLHTSSKTIRSRVMAYLNTLSLRKGSDTVDIPFDRQQMADYLNVERTALSKELSKMQRDGLIRFKGRHFRII